MFRAGQRQASEPPSRRTGSARAFARRARDGARRALTAALALELALGPALGTVPESFAITVQEMHEEPRHALVIGNGAYAHAPLKNPTADADAISLKLAEIGFSVETLMDASRDQMKSAIYEFGKRLRDGGVGVLYYAGHAAQMDGRNYLIPVDAEIEEAGDIEIESVDLAYPLRQLDKARNRANVVVLDSCRDNPFAGSHEIVNKGLAIVRAEDTFVAFATQPGDVAEDGEGRNSPFTTALIGHIDDKGVKVEELFKMVTREVVASTGDRQRPFVSSGLEGEFFFVPPTSEIVSQAEVDVFKRVVGENTTQSLSAYLTQYPNGAFVAEVKRMLEQHRAIAEASEREREVRRAERRRIERLAEKRAEAEAATAAENSMWMLIRDTQDSGTLRRFIEQYPVGIHANEARMRFEKLVANQSAAQAAAAAQRRAEERARAERDAFEAAKASGSSAAVDRFLARYGNGSLAGQAKGLRNRYAENERVQAQAARERAERDALAREDRQVWDEARTSRDRGRVLAYMFQFPEGEYAMDATALLGELEQEELAAVQADLRKSEQERLLAEAVAERLAWQQAEGGGKAEIRAFLRAYPEGEYTELAEAKLDEIKALEEELAAAAAAEADRERRVREEAEAWAGVDEASTASVAAFLDVYPGGANASKAKLALARLERLEAERVAELARVADAKRAAAEAERNRELAEQAAWREATQMGDRDGYEIYLKAFPDGAHVTEARATLDRIAAVEAEAVAQAARVAEQRRRERLAEAERLAEKSAWDRARASADTADVVAFLEAYPEGSFADDAAALIDERNRAEERRAEELARRAEEERVAKRAAEEDAVFARAREGGKRQDFAAYLAAYPEGRFASDAQARIAEFDAAATAQAEADARAAAQRRAEKERTAERQAWQRAEAAGTREAIAGYLAEYPKGADAASARSKLAAIDSAERAQAAEQDRRDEQARIAKAAAEKKAAEQSAWSQAKASDNPETLVAFLAAYPESANVGAARSRLTMLKKLRAEQEAKARAEREKAVADAKRAEQELAAWEAVKDSAEIAPLESYLAKYPEGTFAAVARERITALEGLAEATASAQERIKALQKRVRQNTRHQIGKGWRSYKPAE